MAGRLDGKAAVVTGASRGIGRAVAIELARAGANVAIAARSADGLAATAEAIEGLGRRALPHVADLREPAAATALIEATVAKLGCLDLAFNNAGATKRGDFFALADDDFLDGFALKFHGAVRVARAAWPHLKRSGGTLINIAGSGGKTAQADFTIGGPVNAAVFNLTKALAQLGARDGIRVICISPGAFETERLKGRISAYAKANNLDEATARSRMLAEAGLKRYGDPAEIGRLAAFLAGDAAVTINGAIIEIDGGITRAI
jgi:3-oxoacyl-[acyl-carrier protein] reductase